MVVWRIGEARGQQRFVRTAQITSRWAGGFEISCLETALKTAMKDADLEVAREVLGGRTPGMALPVWVRSLDMAPGC